MSIRIKKKRGRLLQVLVPSLAYARYSDLFHFLGQDRQHIHGIRKSLSEEVFLSWMFASFSQVMLVQMVAR